MKTLIRLFYSFLYLLFVLSCLPQAAAQSNTHRYLDEVFTEVNNQKDIIYANNISILNPSQEPTEINLQLDFYEPVGDTESKRPLVIVFHEGNFLPRGTNGTTMGARDDFPLVEIATRLAKKGYVVAVADYRLGWNPVSSSFTERANTFINAIYRAAQDANTCVRFFRKDAENDNLYGIDSDRITLWGLGTGGLLVNSASSIDSYQDMLIPKLIDPDTGIPYVLEAQSGDPQGTVDAPLNISNHVGYDSKVQLSIGMGGAIGDTSWITSNDPPFINFHCPKDPFLPYKDAPIVSPVGELSLPLQGSYLISQKAKDIGISSIWDEAIFDLDDAVNPTPEIASASSFTKAAKRLNEGIDGLFPIERSCLLNNITDDFCEAAPWNWWDAEYWSTVPHPACPQGIAIELCNYDVIARMYNNDASPEKGNIYLDSIMGYFAPRACVALDLPCKELFYQATGTKNLLEQNIGLTIAPNPAQDFVLFSTKSTFPIEKIELFSMNGSLIKRIKQVKSNEYLLDCNQIPSGMYLAKILVKEGMLAQKIVLK